MFPFERAGEPERLALTSSHTRPPSISRTLHERLSRRAPSLRNGTATRPAWRSLLTSPMLGRTS